MFAINTVGSFSIPGMPPWWPGERREVSYPEAAYLATRPEFHLEFGPNEGQFREDGKVAYLGYFGPVDATFGYGGGGISILRAFTQLGIQAVVSPHYNGTSGPPIDRQSLPSDALPHLDTRGVFPLWTMAHCLPDDLKRLEAPRKLSFTMWETSHIPDGTSGPFGNWAREINTHARHLFVPSQHNAEVFYESGVNVPIDVVGYGLDTDRWPYVERSTERDPFTVVLLGDLTERKGPREAVIAFQRAFPSNPDVRLILKTQWGHLGRFGAPIIGDTRVEIINAHWSRGQVLQLLYDADCFVWPSRGEGFGLPPLQALLTGCPVVTTTHTGMAEWFEPAYAEAIETAGTSPAPISGDWFDPDIDSMADRLRWVYDNRKAALKKATRGAEYLRRQFSLERFAARLGAALDKLEG